MELQCASHVRTVFVTASSSEVSVAEESFLFAFAMLAFVFDFDFDFPFASGFDETLLDLVFCLEKQTLGKWPTLPQVLHSQSRALH